MFSVILYGHEDVEIVADEYEVDEDGDLVFWADEGDDELVEIARFREGAWSGVSQVAEDDEEEDEVKVEDGE